MIESRYWNPRSKSDFVLVSSLIWFECITRMNDPRAFPSFSATTAKSSSAPLLVDWYLCLFSTELPHQHSVNFVRWEPITHIWWIVGGWCEGWCTIKIVSIWKFQKWTFFVLQLSTQPGKIFWIFFFFTLKKSVVPNGESILSGVRDPKKYYRRIFIQRKKNIYF